MIMMTMMAMNIRTITITIVVVAVVVVVVMMMIIMMMIIIKVIMMMIIIIKMITTTTIIIIIITTTTTTTTTIIIIIIAMKKRLLQSPHCAKNCLQHVRSSGQGAIVCKSRVTHRALITCNMSCATWYEGTAQLLSLTELTLHLL